MKQNISVFWFRKDLRIVDNPGLLKSIDQGKVLAIYILEKNNQELGASSKWWLHHSLNSLNTILNNKLNFYVGDSSEIILKICGKYQVSNVYWNRCYEPENIVNDTVIKSNLKQNNINCQSFNASLLWEPWNIKKPDGGVYKIFGYFYRHGCLMSIAPRYPFPAPKSNFINNLIKDEADSQNLGSLNLLNCHQWHKKFNNLWKVGEECAKERLTFFLDNNLADYKVTRDYPAKETCSFLSPHLHFGEISPHQIYYSAITHPSSVDHPEDLEHFLREIAWREFSYYLLYHFPSISEKNFNSKFDKFPWRDNLYFLDAWQKGNTGYPIVDAGMRELWRTGFMHNRLRMIVASFLVKNLLIHWHRGRDWFYNCLLDADLANNSASWQWVAGSGTDASPFYRIFNPLLQGEKFDTEGHYTRKNVPELSKLPNKYLFRPWEAPEDVLTNAGIILGKTYPMPIVDIVESRNLAIKSFKNM